MRAILRVWVPCLCVAAVGCTASYRSLRWNTVDDLTFRYTFETRHDVTTQLEQLPAHADADADAVAALGDQLAEASYSFQGTLEKFKAQYFEDRTHALVVRIAGIEGGLVGADGEMDIAGLGGKSVAMRAFDSGEVFEVFGLEHFSGYGRQGELFADIFPQLVLRLPAELPDVGASARVRSTIPYRLDVRSEVQQTWELVFTRDTEIAPCLLGRACVELSYEGTLRERGLSREPTRVTGVEATGTVQGRLVFALDVGDLQEHRYEVELDRTIRTYERPFDPREEDGEVRAVVRQHDHATTTLRRVP